VQARLIGIILVLGIAAVSAGLWVNHELNAPYYGAHDVETFAEIPRGAKTGEIAALLVKAGIIRNRLLFIGYVRWKNLSGRLQAGDYRFASPATPIQITERIVRGDVYFVPVTIPEGLTAHETIALIADAGVGKLAEMQAALIRTEWIRDLNPAAQNIEGYLFPETYHFSRRIASDEILKTMTDQFRLRLKKLMALYPLPHKLTVAQLVTLASMIEKEASGFDERPLIGSVLLNRIEKGMPLACDPTIIYALKLAGKYNGNIRKVDLGINSPYNTYIRAGLPPGPISNPGEESLRAALVPAKTDYLYFVARNDGTHQFSKDFRSHSQAVSQFQKPHGTRKSAAKK
jgi:UPF0755 protein